MDKNTMPGAHSAIRVLTALAELGDATAAAIAEKAGLGYSTTTPKLRAWEESGRAERFRTDDGRTLWRLTPSGRAATEPAGATTSPAGPTTAPGGDTTVTATGPTGTTTVDTTTVPGRDTAVTAAAGPTGTTTADTTTRPADAGATVRLGGLAGGADGCDEKVGNPTSPTAPCDADTAAQAAEEPEGQAAALPGIAHTDPVKSAVAPPGESDRPERTDGAPPQRRRPGSIPAALRAICQSHPDRHFSVGELCKLIDAADSGTGMPKASQGAVYAAATKLAAAGTLTQTSDRPAAFQLTPAGERTTSRATDGTATRSADGTTSRIG